MTPCFSTLHTGVFLLPQELEFLRSELASLQMQVEQRDAKLQEEYNVKVAVAPAVYPNGLNAEYYILQTKDVTNCESGILQQEARLGTKLVKTSSTLVATDGVSNSAKLGLYPPHAHRGANVPQLRWALSVYLRSQILLSVTYIGTHHPITADRAYKGPGPPWYLARPT